MQKLIKVALGFCLIGALLSGCTAWDGLPSKTCIDQASESTVIIEMLSSSSPDWRFTGTGFVVGTESYKGRVRSYVVSAKHVLNVPEGTQLSVRAWKNGEWSKERWIIDDVHLSSDRDLGVCRVEFLDLLPLELGTVSPKVGETIWSLGAHWYGHLMFLPGKVIGFTPWAEESKGDILADNHVTPGCSGGPMLKNVDGVWKVIGVDVRLSIFGGVIYPQCWAEPIEELVIFLNVEGIPR